MVCIGHSSQFEFGFFCARKEKSFPYPTLGTSTVNIPVSSSAKLWLLVTRARTVAFRFHAELQRNSFLHWYGYNICWLHVLPVLGRILYLNFHFIDMFYFSLQDYTIQPPTQELVVRDLHDNTWTFRHIYRGEYAFLAFKPIYCFTRKKIGMNVLLWIQKHFVLFCCNLLFGFAAFCWRHFFVFIFLTI